MTTRPENIVFIINPSNWYESMYPTGILCLSSYLEQKGYSNVIVDSKISSSRLPPSERMQRIVDHISNLKPEVVCFSSSHREFGEVTQLNASIKKAVEGLFTIVGGAQPTYRYQDFLSSGFDYVAIGEGEKTLVEFVREIAQQTFQWAGIDGLVWRQGDVITKNKARQLLNEEELSNAPLPAYQKIDPRYFDYNVKTIRGLPLRGGLLLTTRGCPFQCTFCGCNLIFGRKLRSRHIDRVEADIDCLCSQYRVEGIWIVDDTFTVNKVHAINIARLLKTKGVLWGCQSRVDAVNDELLKVFKECGCVQIDYGVESGSPRILTEVIKKGTSPDQIRNAFELTKKHGIRTLANIMIGLPTETLGDLGQTQKIVAEIQPDVTVVAIATPLPGTELYGMVGEDISPSQYASLDWNGSEMTARLNKSEIKNVVSVHHAMKKRYLLRSVLNVLLNGASLGWLLSKGDKWRRMKTVGAFLVDEMRK